MSYIAPNPPWAGYTPPVGKYVLLDPTNVSNRYEFYYAPNFPWKPKQLSPTKSAITLGGSIWQYRIFSHLEFTLALKAFPYNPSRTSSQIISIKDHLMPLLENKIEMIFVNPGAIYPGYFYVVETSDEYELNIYPGETLCDLELTLRTTEH